MRNIETTIKMTFKEFKEIFDGWHKNYPPMKKSPNQLNLYIPDEKVGFLDGLLSGLKLKDEVGYIKIQQTLDRKGSPVSYLYSFISSEYEYLIMKKDCKNIDDNGCFYFHFQKNENNIPHKPHVSVMSPSTFRYFSKDIALKEFLSFIRNNFYLPSGVKRNNLLVGRYKL